MESRIIGVAILAILMGALLGAGASWSLLDPRLDDLCSQMTVLKGEITSSTAILDKRVTSNLTDLYSELESIYNDLHSRLVDISSILDSQESSMSEQQKEINQLINETLRIGTEIDKVKNKRYRLVYEINGTEDVTSGNFTIEGNTIRIAWDAEISQTNGWIDIRLYSANGTYLTRRTASGVYSTLSSDIYIDDPGDFYMIIETSHIEVFSVYVWDYC